MPSLRAAFNFEALLNEHDVASDHRALRCVRPAVAAYFDKVRGIPENRLRRSVSGLRRCSRLAGIASHRWGA